MREPVTISSLTESAKTCAVFLPRTGFLPPLPDSARRLPQSVRRCPDVDNDRPDSENLRPVFKSRRPECRTFRPVSGNACPGFNSRGPGFQNTRPELVSHCPGFSGLCPGFQTVAPLLKAFAPISGTLRLFCNMLPQSYLRIFTFQPSTDPMSNHRPHFPVSILTHNGGLIIAAAKNHAEIATRLTAAYITAADTLCQKVAGEVTGQKTAKGELGNLTLAQQQNLTTLHQCLAQAAKTAKRAFPGQTVKLHQEFQIVAHDANDLRSEERRVGKECRSR